MRLLVCLGVLLLSSAAAPGEDAAKFVIADVHPIPAIVNDNLQQMSGGLMQGGRYQLRRATMLDLITRAYGVSSDRVVGGPSWLEMDRYDVIAKGPADMTSAAAKMMLRSLLAERFALVIHDDKKPMPAFALTAGRKTQLKKSDGSGDSGCKSDVQNIRPDGPASDPVLPTVMVTCNRVTMEALATALGRMPASFQYIGERRVVDQTNLDGEWDFTFHYNIRARATRPGMEILTMFDALEKQLGIAVQPSTASTPVLVVESVNRKPTPNSPEVEKAFPPQPLEFEVATIRATDPGYRGQSIRLLPGGRIEIRGVPLKPIIADLWGFSDDMIFGAPGFSESERWDIVAKAPAAAAILDGTSDQDDQPPVDIETLFNMAKTLLAQRFKLAVHMEERTMPAYTITALRPKMKKADPAERTRCAEGPAALAKTDARDANPLRGRLMTCYNISMAQLAERLRMLANGYVHSPVLDSTGLEGGYDLTLNFSTVGQLRGGGPPVPGLTAEAIDDPNGAISLPDAMEKQLGIRMELQKRPVQVLVIDHLEQQPTDN